MKFINLDGLTTAERLVVLENICNDIIMHLNKETLYTTVDEYNTSTLNYEIDKLYPETDVMPESGQLVYFSNGYVGIIGNIDTIANTYGISEITQIKGDDAIEYSGQWETSTFPIKGNIFTDNNDVNYSRTPKANDKIIICGYTNTSPKRSFMCLGTLLSTTPDIKWTINNVVETTGEKGEKGDKGETGESPDLYRHIIRFSQASIYDGSLIIYSLRNIPYDMTTLRGFLSDIRCSSGGSCYPASGQINIEGKYAPIVGVYAAGSSLYIHGSGRSSIIASITDNFSKIE